MTGDFPKVPELSAEFPEMKTLAGNNAIYVFSLPWREGEGLDNRRVLPAIAAGPPRSRFSRTRLSPAHPSIYN